MDKELEQLHHSVKLSMINQEILMKDIKDVKFVLIGNELNNSRGLVKDFQEHKEETKEVIEKLDKRVKETENYQIGMKTGVKFIIFAITSGIVLGIVKFLGWIKLNF